MGASPISPGRGGGAGGNRSAIDLKMGASPISPGRGGGAGGNRSAIDLKMGASPISPGRGGGAGGNRSAIDLKMGASPISTGQRRSPSRNVEAGVNPASYPPAMRFSSLARRMLQSGFVASSWKPCSPDISSYLVA